MKTRMCVTGLPLWRGEHKVQALLGVGEQIRARQAAARGPQICPEADREPEPSGPSPSSPVVALGSGWAFALRKYEELARKHLDEFGSKVFEDFTGLHFDVWWPACFGGRTDWGLSSGPLVCQSLMGSSQTWPGSCWTCWQQQLSRTLKEGHAGHGFACPLGVNNFCLSIIVQGVTVGIAFIQALDKRGRNPGRGASVAVEHLGRGHHEPASSPVAASGNCADLEPAASLLKLVVREVEMAELAELRQAELSKVRRAIAAHEREEDHLRKLLHRSLRVVCETSAEFKPEAHSEQLAHGLDLADGAQLSGTGVVEWYQRKKNKTTT